MKKLIEYFLELMQNLFTAILVFRKIIGFLTMEDREDLAIKAQSAQGLKWMTAAEIGMRCAQFSAIHRSGEATLGRACLEFLEFFMLNLFFRLTGAIGDLGFGTIVIQKIVHMTNRMVNSATMMSILFSTILCLGTYSFAGYLHQFFPYDGMVEVVKVFSFIFIISGLNIIFRSVFIRNLRFSDLAAVQFFACISWWYCILGSCHKRDGYMESLVAGLYIESFLQVIIMIVISKEKIRPWVAGIPVKEDMKFAFKILFTRSVYFLNGNLGALLIGSHRGTEPWGFYIVTYGITDMPVQRISKNVGYFFAMATLSKFRKKLSSILSTCRKRLIITFLLVVFSLFVGMFVVAKEVVLGFYGGEWVGMVDPIAGSLLRRYL